VPQRRAHEAKAGEVARLALGPLILFGAGGVIAGEVEVPEGGTHSGHHLLELFLLLLVPETVLLFALALVTGVASVVVVVLVGGVELLPLRAVGDIVGGVVALEATSRRHPPLLAESVQCAELPRQQGNLVVGDALVLLIRNCTQGRQSKLQNR
jgi:H+/Cl- antiporter ClcA